MALIAGEDDFSASGIVPADWLAPRLMGSAHAWGNFASVCDASWIARLRIPLARECAEAGIADFDLSVIMSQNRRLTQRISEIVHRDAAQYDGIAYLCRHAVEIGNWALFEPFSQISGPAAAPISGSAPDLIEALRIFNLRMV